MKTFIRLELKQKVLFLNGHYSDFPFA